ncbi:hypothetical protein EV356DRAFT_507932 [Viridothelium virens]|uniref:Uncharacterized protein n=1 Tax=Viridothelium virens TaxID=1048519 RepID=A0A6A6GYY8_VIRVR|nr:hypothetical protein EV356DRAFT_507932 [Viridothelium virens]
MPPIPVYSDRPINPAKAEDAEPQTSSPHTNTGNQPSSNLASTTTGQSPRQYAPAAPGAAPAPAPTGSITSNVPEVHAVPQQLEPTRTIPAASDGPPPPQPGSVPVPGATAPMTASQNTGSIPPPPRPGDAPQTTPTSSQSAAITPAPSTTTAGAPQGPPSQFSIPPPTQNAAPTRSTTGGTTLSYEGQYGTGAGQTGGVPPAMLSAQSRGESAVNPEHPPGYVQNPYADMMSASQRAANDEAGGAGGVPVSSGEGEGGLWDTAKKWVGEAGKGLQQLEEETWKRVNGK